MTTKPLRVALFSGNYNYVRDGANQALNRLVGYLLRQGVEVRIYAPEVKKPAFPATGTLVGLPSLAIFGRGEYRITTGLSNKIRRDLAAFNPDILHISAPDPAAHRAVVWAKENGLPVVASVHTRFETYLKYYHLSALEPLLLAILRRLYRRCDQLLAPVESTAEVLRQQKMGDTITLWGRGIDHDQFNPNRRSLEWRREQGIADDEVVIVFLGRLVLEKGLDVFANVMTRLESQNINYRPLIIGEGPARKPFEEKLKKAVFTGFLEGNALGQALASGDVLFNPSVTEAFGNVTQEAFSCGLPVVAAAVGTNSLVEDGVRGTLVKPDDLAGYAHALANYARDPVLRAKHGKAGIAFAQTRHWDEINNTVLETYHQLVESNQQKKEANHGI